jgi:hypothetical protein
VEPWPLAVLLVLNGERGALSSVLLLPLEAERRGVVGRLFGIVYH